MPEVEVLRQAREVPQVQGVPLVVLPVALLVDEECNDAQYGMPFLAGRYWQVKMGKAHSSTGDGVVGTVLGWIHLGQRVTVGHFRRPIVLHNILMQKVFTMPKTNKCSVRWTDLQLGEWTSKYSLLTCTDGSSCFIL